MKKTILLLAIAVFTLCSFKTGSYPCHPNGDIYPCTHAMHPNGDIGPCQHFDFYGNRIHTADLYPCTHPMHSLGDLGPCQHVCF